MACFLSYLLRLVAFSYSKLSWSILLLIVGACLRFLLNLGSISYGDFKLNIGISTSSARSKSLEPFLSRLMSFENGWSSVVKSVPHPPPEHPHPRRNDELEFLAYIS